MINNVSRQVFLKIFRRVFFLQLLSLLVIFFVTYKTTKRLIEENFAINTTEHIHKFIKKNQSYIEDEENFCKNLPINTEFILILESNKKISCLSKNFRNFSEKDILHGFDKVRIGTHEYVRNRRIKKNNLYIYFSFEKGIKNYSVYYISQANPENIGTLEIKKRLFYLFILLFLIVSLLSYISSKKLSKPVNSIIKKIFKLSNDYEERNLIEKIEGSHDSEWEIIETSFDRTQSANEKLASNLTMEITKFQVLLDAISDPILSIDPKGRILFANDSFLEILSTSRLENFIGLFYLDIARHYELKDYLDTVLNDNNSDNQGNSKPSKEIKFELKNSTKYFLVKSNKLNNVDGNHFGYVCIFNDITKLKLAEKMRVDFVGNVSHEIRTPLTSIKGYVQTLSAMMSSKEKEGKEDIFDIIESNCDRLTNLFNDLLSLSTIDSQTDVNHEPINVRLLSEQVVSNAKNVFPDAQVDIEYDTNVEDFYSDSILVENILQNLVSNSYKYIGRKGCLKITWKQIDDKILLFVSDDGQGIPAEHLPRLFERFYRVDQSRVRDPKHIDYGGSGLGLSIVKSSINKLGGKVSVKSEVSKGTEFCVEIPLKH